MDALVKNHTNTFYNGSDSDYPPSELDHVFAARHLQFQNVDAANNAVRVTGWAELPTDAQKDNWINEYSDHAPLIFTLTGVV